MGARDTLRDEIDAYFEDEMAGSVPDSIRMLERYSPGAMEGFYRLRRGTTAESSLPKKVRELIIIAVEAALKKEPIGHARIAVEAGVTPQEIHDAVALTLWLAGMPAYHHGMKAVQAAEEHLARLTAGDGQAPARATKPKRGAATYPAAPVTFVAAAPPGGGWHQTCEHVVRALREERLLPVEAQMVTTPGGLKVFEDVVANRRGDSHTLVGFSPGLTLQILMKGSRYSYADTTPIAAVSTDYGALVVRASSDVRDVRDLLARLRRDPASLAVGGGSGPGAMHHGMIAVAAVAAGVAPQQVRYVGGAGVREAVTALVEGQTDVAALGAADVLDEVRGGRVRVLGVLAERRLPGALRDVPTATEQGVAVVFPMWRGFYAPPGVPAEVVAYWADRFTRLCASPTWARVLEETAWFPFLLTGDAFGAFLDEDTQRYAAALGPMRA